MVVGGCFDRCAAALLILALASLPVWVSAQDAAPDADDQAEAPAAQSENLRTLQQAQVDTIRRYRQLIGDLENNGGAYNPALTEPLLELGTALQQSGLHAEAVDILKRGVHLARINHGLYSEIQLALLESEIRSHIALGQFEEADERHRYLYRVQQRTLTDTGRGLAFMRQARWQRRAYELELDEDGYNRLINMWNLYRMALAEFAEAEGDAAPTLLPPLYGMVRAQYLLSGSRGENSSGRFRRDTFQLRESQGRFQAFRGQSFKQGESVIRAIYDVTAAQPESERLARAEVMVMLGDWRLWHGRDREAMDAYAEAIIELAPADNAQEGMQQLFGNPVPLPALEGIRPLPPAGAPDPGKLLLEFTVDERGRVRDLERLDNDEANEGIAYRIMRTLRQTPFRPRFQTGEPVATTGIQWAYDAQEWQ
jgi:hypothetical protein